MNQDQSSKNRDDEARARTLTPDSSGVDLRGEQDEIAEEKREHPGYRPFQAGFWDKDPETTLHRTTYLRIVGLGCFLTILAIFAYLSIFWGSLWQVQVYVHRMNGWIVDFDGGLLGETVREGLLNVTGPPEQLTWQVIDASQFSGPEDLVDAVVKERCWVAVTINPGASARLTAALETANSSYNGSDAVSTFAAEARNENSYPLFLLPAFQQPLTNIAESFAAQNAKSLASNSSINFQNLLAAAPNVLTQPLFFTVNNVRPFDIPVATAVDFVGLIYLLILAFVVSMISFNARVVRSKLNIHLRTSSLLILRPVAPLCMYFFISFFFSLLSLAFQVKFSRYIGHAGFVVYWMMNWMGMSALGLAMESMITLLTPAFVPFFLIIWIISNVSVAFFPIELLPGVFKYGYATPFYNVSRTVRTILFNTRNQIGLNFGVQFAWIFVSIITMTIFQYIFRLRTQRQLAAQNANNEKV